MTTLHDAALELPGYSANAPQQPIAAQSDHSYALETTKGKKWLSLFVKSRSNDPKSLPLFYEKDVVSGRIELDLEKSETIKGLVISVGDIPCLFEIGHCSYLSQVRAGTTSVGQEEELFLNITYDIWNPALGHPTDDKASPSKLKGQYSWPFSIHLPSETTVKGAKNKSLFNLPPTFTERASPAYIDYKIVVTVKRAALRVNQTYAAKNIHSLEAIHSHNSSNQAHDQFLIHAHRHPGSTIASSTSVLQREYPIDWARRRS